MRLTALVLVVVSALHGLAEAASGPRWSSTQLATFADVIVSGRVEAVSSGWDPAVESIYTYATIEVDEVFKGDVSHRIVVKQLGGLAEGIGLRVPDQASFTVGERVLLYLDVRPRDGSLYTTALWQGKWNLETGTYGERIAVRTAPDHESAGTTDWQEVALIGSSVRAARTSGVRVNEIPADAPTVVTQAFALLGPYRWLTIPAVDTQSGGQSGLAGNGFSEIANSIGRWNAAGTGTRLARGSSSAAPKCTSQLTGNGRVTITFNDPCGEMSNSGGTVAIGGAAYFAGEGGTNNGVTFGRAVEGFIINNDSSIAQNLLRQSGCFEDIITHELGHVLGLDHSNDSNAIMFPTVNNTCSGGAHSLGSDDRNGIVAIYGGSALPSSTTPPSSAPSNVQVIVYGTTSLTVSWSAVAAVTAVRESAATSYRVDFRGSPTGAILASATSSTTSLGVAIPAGVAGTFYVWVTPLNSAGAGPVSAPRAFTIESPTPGPGSCTSPPGAVTGLTGTVSGGVASARWMAVPGASTYLVQAGSAPGAANLAPITDIGNNVGVQAQVPAGFTAWVRVFARNACGTSAGTDIFLQ